MYQLDFVRKALWLIPVRILSIVFVFSLWLVAASASSQFAVSCDGVPVGGVPSFQWAQSKCSEKSMFVASPSNPNDNALLKQVIVDGGFASNTWFFLSGSDGALEGTWKWLDGPDQGKVFWIGAQASHGGLAVGGVDTPWDASEPGPDGDEGDLMVFWVTSNTAFWGDITIGGAFSIQCYACQKMPCVDVCNAANTANVVGAMYPGDCACVCKPGWRGIRCDTQFSVHCGVGEAAWISTCASAGGFMAAPRSQEDGKKIVQLNGLPYTALGGQEYGGTSNFRFIDGPEKGRVFYFNRAAVNGRYAVFLPASEPNNDGGNSYIITFRIEGFWGNAPRGSISCVACQYMACTEMCSTANTETVEGLEYPNCTCHCKPGWRGDRCDTHFTVLTPSSPPTIESARALCAAHGGFVALPSSSAEDLQLFSLGGTMNSFLLLGAELVVSQLWVVADGPQRGRAVWNGSHSGVAPTGLYTAFLTSEPTGSGAALAAGVVLTQPGWRDVLVPSAAVANVACQYMACSDACNASTTLSRTGVEWPCTCHCAAGFEGPTCSCVQQCLPIGTLSIIEWSGTLVCHCACKSVHRGRYCEIFTNTPTLTLTRSLIRTVSLSKVQSTSLSISSTLSEEGTTSESEQRTVSHTSTRTLSYAQSASAVESRSPSPHTTLTSSASFSTTEASSHSKNYTQSPVITLSASSAPSSTATRSESRVLPCHYYYVAAPLSCASKIGGLNGSVVSPGDIRSCWNAKVPYTEWFSGSTNITLPLPSAGPQRGNGAPVRGWSFTALGPGKVDVPAVTLGMEWSAVGLNAMFAYAGGNRLDGVSVQIVFSFDSLLVCRTDAAHNVFVYNILLEGSSPAVDTGTVTDATTTTTAVASSLSGSPTTVVRGGMLSSLGQLLRCAPMDVTAELPLVTNLLSLKIGLPEGQYQRGSLVSGCVVGFGLCVLVSVVLTPAKLAALRWEHTLGACGGPAPGWSDAMRAINIPSLFFVPMALLSEAWIPSGMTLLTMDAASVGDRVAGAVVVVLMTVYAAHICYVTSHRPPVRIHMVEYRSQERSVRRRMVEYWFLPSTAVLPADRGDWGEGDAASDKCGAMDVAALRTKEGLNGLRSAGESGKQAAHWLSRYLRYSDGLRVLWFSGAEFVAGSIVNVIDGMVTNLCILKSSFILIVALVTVILIVWLKPYGVRSQQLAGIVVYGLMVVAAILVITSNQVNRPIVEDVAGFVFSAASAVVMLQALVDLVVTILEGREAVHQTKLGLSRLREKREAASLLPPIDDGGTVDAGDSGVTANPPNCDRGGIPQDEMNYVRTTASFVMGRELSETELLELEASSDSLDTFLFTTLSKT